jgi:hypothetical protein
MQKPVFPKQLADLLEQRKGATRVRFEVPPPMAAEEPLRVEFIGWSTEPGPSRAAGLRMPIRAERGRGLLARLWDVLRLPGRRAR